MKLAHSPLGLEPTHLINFVDQQNQTHHPGSIAVSLSTQSETWENTEGQLTGLTNSSLILPGELTTVLTPTKCTFVTNQSTLSVDSQEAYQFPNELITRDRIEIHPIAKTHQEQLCCQPRSSTVFSQSLSEDFDNDFDALLDIGLNDFHFEDSPNVISSTQQRNQSSGSIDTVLADLLPELNCQQEVTRLIDCAYGESLSPTAQNFNHHLFRRMSGDMVSCRNQRDGCADGSVSMKPAKSNNIETNMYFSFPSEKFCSTSDVCNKNDANAQNQGERDSSECDGSPITFMENIIKLIPDGDPAELASAAAAEIGTADVRRRAKQTPVPESKRNAAYYRYRKKNTQTARSFRQKEKASKQRRLERLQQIRMHREQLRELCALLEQEHRSLERAWRTK